MRSLSKKAQVNVIGPAMIALVIASAFLVFGAIIIQELRDTDIVSESQSVAVANETLTTVTEVGETVTHAGSCGFGGFTVNAVINATNDVVTSGNYTTTSAGVVSMTTAGGSGYYNNTDLKVSYNYNWGDEACIGANETLVGLGTFADFWEIIVLAIVISVIIGLLLVVFGGRRTR